MKNLAMYALALMMFCSSCATIMNPPKASKHPGVTTVEKPKMSEKDDLVWKNYYVDQFDAYEGMVTPPSDTYPEAAKRGYYLAKNEWSDTVEKIEKNHAIKNILIIPAVIIGIYVLIGIASYGG